MSRASGNSYHLPHPTALGGVKPHRANTWNGALLVHYAMCFMQCSFEILWNLRVPWCLKGHFWNQAVSLPITSRTQMRSQPLVAAEWRMVFPKQIRVHQWWALLDCNSHGNLRYPHQCHPPPRNKPLIRPYQGKPMVNSPLIRPYFLGG